MKWKIPALLFAVCDLGHNRLIEALFACSNLNIK